jgi:AraC-like DNA-binding protein
MTRPWNEITKLWKPQEGIQVLSARLVTHTFPRHTHETYTIGLNYGGLGQFWCRGRMWTAYPGTLNLILPGEVHTGEPIGVNWRYDNLYFDLDLVHGVMGQLGLSAMPYFNASIVDDPTAKNALYHLVRSFKISAPKLEIETRVLALFRHVLTHTDNNRVPFEAVGKEAYMLKQVRDFLQDHHAEDISIEQVAAYVNLNPYYLIRVFAKNVGMPPHAYLLQVRLNYARKDLRTAKPLFDVALDNGFYDQSHLTNAFKKFYGITPNEYRKVNFFQDLKTPSL